MVFDKWNKRRDILKQNKAILEKNGINGGMNQVECQRFIKKEFGVDYKKEVLSVKHIQAFKDMKESYANSYDIKVPVNKDGASDALFMGSVFGKSGLALSSLANNGIKWTSTKLYLRDQSIVIDLTGESVLYSDIKLIEKGKIMNIFLKNGNNISLKLNEQEALKRVIESKMESNSKIIESKTNFDGDKLIKYAEMLENGLITKEEFITLKNNLK